MPLPIVAIIGRPNVGKSTFFNRISKSRHAITADIPGITRDRLYRTVEWQGKYFIAVDTGGFQPRSDEIFDTKIREQVQIAIEEADLTLFMVDAQVGSTEIDQVIARMLLKQGKPTVLVANKSDNEQLMLDANSLYSLGLGEPFAISAIAGRNIGNLLDKIVSSVPSITEPEKDEERIRIAVIGRPNVGKSSIVNHILGIDRLLVTDIPGTTRDSVDTEIEYQDQKFVLVDTAGLRRAEKITDNVEFYTSLRTIRALQRADIAMVLVEGQSGMSGQDIKIIEQAEDERKGIVVVVNKWDLVEKDSHTADEFQKSFHQLAPMMTYIPLVFVSAKTGQRVSKVLDMILAINVSRNTRVPTPDLNDFLQEALRERTPPARRGQLIKFFYATQTDAAPPSFLFFVNHPEALDKAYIRFLENRLRDRFGFEGNSLRLKFKKRT